MTDKDKALSLEQTLRLALEALKEDRAWLETDAPTEVWEKNNEAITAIKAALEAKDEPEQLRDENERLHVENRRLIDRIETIGVPVGVGGFATTTSQEAKDKPVAWVYESVCGNDFVTRNDTPSYAKNIRPLYTAPHKRKPLTDEEMQRIIHEHTKLNPNQRDDKQLIGYIINATRAIEAAHVIKGEA